MVIGRRIHEGRENSVVRVFCDRFCIEAGSGAWIDLENSVARYGLGGGAMPASGESQIGGVFSQRVFRTCSSVWPSRLEPRHVRGEEAR